jgi:hypothetical protein
MYARAETRVAFSEKLQAAEVVGREGVTAAMPYISMVKIVATPMAQTPSHSLISESARHRHLDYQWRCAISAASPQA